MEKTVDEGKGKEYEDDRKTIRTKKSYRKY